MIPVIRFFLMAQRQLDPSADLIGSPSAASVICGSLGRRSHLRVLHGVVRHIDWEVFMTVTQDLPKPTCADWTLDSCFIEAGFTLGRFTALEPEPSSPQALRALPATV